ncbi:hypothetical protein Tco_0979453 [Tanacetum coccineum]
MTSSITRPDVENFNRNGVLKHEGGAARSSENHEAEIIHDIYDAAVAQRNLEVKHFEGKINTDCLLNEQANAVEKKEVKESKKANLSKILKCNAKLTTRWSPIRGY